jgi:crotonobetainyl-CoA:carnitine CoA-transferase CaiB-like acyl-CoA transferase
MAGPLSGIRILDLSTVIAGPYATQVLGDMGAEILKIEPPQGDIMRAPGPGRSAGMGATFLNCNRNKRSIVLDLKQAQDHDALMDMVGEAQVVVHNMRPAAAARLGLTYDDMRARNPSIIFCAIVGYGQQGVYRDRPAYDDVIQAAAGWAGMEQRMGGEPRYAPTTRPCFIARRRARGNMWKCPCSR